VFLEKSIEDLKKECSPNVVPIRLDVTNELSVEQAAQSIKEYLSTLPGAQLKALVNNAGILVQPCPAEWQSAKDFKDMFNVNVLGTVIVTNSVLPLIRKSQGRIVCTASIAGRVAMTTQAAYCASKFAVEAYADVLRKDMYPFGVTVHVVEPGVFPNTSLYERFQTGLDHVWARLPENIKADYGENFYKYQRALLGHGLKELGRGNPDNSAVSKAYVHAVTDASPHYRYRVGADSKYLFSLLSVLSEHTVDTIFTMSDPRLPAVAPATAPANGLQIAWGRYYKNWTRFSVIAAVVAFILHRARKSFY